jgi:hypothetical protein
MCRECDNSGLDWPDRDKREIEIARERAMESFDRSINILNENKKIIDSLKSTTSILRENLEKL